MYCVNIETDDKISIHHRDISKYIRAEGTCIFVSFLNDGDVMLLIYENGCVMTMDSSTFIALHTLKIGTLYKDLGTQMDTENYRYNARRHRNFKIVTATLNIDKKCIAWIEREYDVIYYLQIYSLDLIYSLAKHTQMSPLQRSDYLMISKLISVRNDTGQYKICYPNLYRETFRGLMKKRSTQWSVDPMIKRRNTQYLVGTMAAINDKTVRLMLNKNADKLLYSSIDDMSNDLLVMDRNTMTTLNVTCKGVPSGWIFKDYLMVSSIGSHVSSASGGFTYRKDKKCATLDIQGFISETSVAEVLCDEVIGFPWCLCLEIAVFVGCSREFRNISFADYQLKDKTSGVLSDIVLGKEPCLNVWNIDHYLVVRIKDQIIFYDSSFIKFKDDDTLITYTNNHAIIATNKRKHSTTSSKLWRKLHQST